MVAGSEQHRAHRLGQALAHHHLARQAAVALIGRELTDLRAPRHGAGDVGVAVVAGDLLDHVDLALGVRAEGRDGHVEHALPRG